MSYEDDLNKLISELRTLASEEKEFRRHWDDRLRFKFFEEQRKKLHSAWKTFYSGADKADEKLRDRLWTEFSLGSNSWARILEDNIPKAQAMTLEKILTEERAQREKLREQYRNWHAGSPPSVLKGILWLTGKKNNRYAKLSFAEGEFVAFDEDVIEALENIVVGADVFYSLDDDGIITELHWVQPEPEAVREAEKETEKKTPADSGKRIDKKKKLISVALDPSKEDAPYPWEKNLKWVMREQLFPKRSPDKVEITNGRIDHKMMIVFCLVAKAYWNRLQSEPKLALPFIEKEDDYETLEVRNVVAHCLYELKAEEKETRNTFPELRRAQVEILESEIRRDLPKLRKKSPEAIKQFLKKVGNTVIWVTTREYRETDEGEERIERCYNRLLCEVESEKVDKKPDGSGTWKPKELKFRFELYSPIMLGMMNELRKGNIDLLPARLNRLSGGTQELLWSLWSVKHETVHFNLAEGRAARGWKKRVSDDQLRHDVIKIRRYLDEAKEAGFLDHVLRHKSWTTGKGVKTVFHVRKLPFRLF